MTTSSTLTGLLFDFDGTVLDTIELILASFRHTLTVHHGRPPPDDVFLAGVGTPLRTQLGDLARGPDELEAMLVTYRDFNFENHDRLARPYPHMQETLEVLHEKGVPMGIVTSKRRFGLDRGLDDFGLRSFFRVTISADDIDRHKPHPEPVLAGARGLGLDPAQTIYIGDATHDLRAGRSAGTRTGAALWGAFDPSGLLDEKPDYTLSSPEDVLNLPLAV